MISSWKSSAVPCKPNQLMDKTHFSMKTDNGTKHMSNVLQMTVFMDNSIRRYITLSNMRTIMIYIDLLRCTGRSTEIDFCWHLTSVLLQIAVLISVGFIGCWAPYSVVCLWSILGRSTIPPEVSLLPCMFAKSSTVYNPIIYYIFSQSFKREVKQMHWLCLSSNSCHVTNSISDNNIYMVSTDIKPKVTARSSLPEIMESRTVTLGWMTFLGDMLEKNDFITQQRLCAVNCGKVCGLIMCNLTNNTRTGMWYYCITSRVVLESCVATMNERACLYELWILWKFNQLSCTI